MLPGPGPVYTAYDRERHVLLKMALHFRLAVYSCSELHNCCTAYIVYSYNFLNVSLGNLYL